MHLSFWRFTVQGTLLSIHVLLFSPSPTSAAFPFTKHRHLRYIRSMKCFNELLTTYNICVHFAHRNIAPKPAQANTNPHSDSTRFPPKTKYFQAPFRLRILPLCPWCTISPLPTKKWARPSDWEASMSQKWMETAQHMVWRAKPTA